MALKTITTDLCFAEGPRWHDGALWFSDMHDHVVCRIDAEGNKTVVAEVPQQPWARLVAGWPVTRCIDARSVNLGSKPARP